MTGKVYAQADPGFRGIIGVGSPAPAGYSAIGLRFDGGSEATPEDLNALMVATEPYCTGRYDPAPATDTDTCDASAGKAEPFIGQPPSGPGCHRPLTQPSSSQDGGGGRNRVQGPSAPANRP
jgi:hypothetical protein